MSVTRLVAISRKAGIGCGGGELNLHQYLDTAVKHDINVHWLCDQVVGPTADELHAEKTDWSVLSNVLDDLAPDAILVNSDVIKTVADCIYKTGIPVIVYLQSIWPMVRHADDTWDNLDDLNSIPPDILDEEGCEALSKASVLMANSEFTKDLVEKILKLDAVLALPKLSQDSIVDGDSPLETRNVILSASGQPLKGALKFIKLSQEFPEYQFVMLAGDCNNEDWPSVERAWAEAGDNLTVIREWQPKMSKFYKTARCVFVGTETSEAFCCVVAECFVNGIPIIMTNVGHLRRMHDTEHSIMVPRNSSVDIWSGALMEALQLRPYRSNTWNQDHTRKLPYIVKELAAKQPTLARGPEAAEEDDLSRVVILKPNSPGVSAAVMNAHYVLGVDTGLWESTPADLDKYDLVVVPSRFHHMMHLHRKKKLAFWWCSHMSQMDIYREEWPPCIEVLQAVQQYEKRWFLTTSEGDAWFLNQHVSPSCLWFPPCMEDKLGFPEGSVPKLEGFHVFIPGPYGPRKNVAVAFAAAYDAGATIHMTDWITEGHHTFPQIRSLCELANVRNFRVHHCENRGDAWRVAAQCQVVLNTSLAETWSYASAECVLAGTPVLGSVSIPCLEHSPVELQLNDPTDVSLVSHWLSKLMEDYEKGNFDHLVQDQQQAVFGEVRRSNEQAKQTLKEILDA